MKKFFISLIAFAGVACIICCLGIIAFGRFVPFSVRSNLPYVLGGVGYSYTRFNEAKEIDRNVDVLVVGSSHAYRGYDPRIFEQYDWKLFNLGSSAQTPVQTAYLFDKYIAKFRPKLVVIDVYPVLFKSDGIESVIDLVSNGELDEELVRLSVAQNNISVYNTLFYRAFADAFGFNKGFVEKNPSSTGDLYVSGGYVESKGRFKGKKEFKATSYSFLPNQVDAFEHIIAKMRQRNIPYIILQSPIPQAKYARVTNNAYADAFFSKYGFYRNANEVLKLPDSCFLDESHLNQWGVNRYNEYVVNLIKEKGYLNVKKREYRFASKYE
ncbi:hypothetical protein [Olivibacter jilunii]|uniref:hypothetical protein n=1 Tax=Olivibacter jilunii TaxID=985016 RepID=UPI003F186FF8